MLFTCVLTVASLIDNRSAISRLLCPVGDFTEDFRFALSQIVGRARRDNGRRRAAQRAFEQPPLDRWVQQRLARDDYTNRVLDLRRGGVLGQVPPCAGVEGSKDRVVVGVGRQHDDARVWQVAQDAASGGHAVAARHAQVHQHDVRSVAVRKLGGFFTVRRGRHYFDSWREPQQHDQAFAHHRLVVRDQHANCWRLYFVGSHRRTLNPLATGPASSVPPRSSARSRIPTRP